MIRYCLTLDLKDDAKLIEEYELFHTKVWPEVKESIRSSGINNMQIYRFSTRLFMIMEVSDYFTFDNKSAADAKNAKVQEWEELMWRFQRPVPGCRQGEKWVLMDKIFDL